eukprot:15451776-Alexandrium_andersonii.AAC.2
MEKYKVLRAEQGVGDEASAAETGSMQPVMSKLDDLIGVIKNGPKPDLPAMASQSSSAAESGSAAGAAPDPAAFVVKALTDLLASLKAPPPIEAAKAVELPQRRDNSRERSPRRTSG